MRTFTLTSFATFLLIQASGQITPTGTFIGYEEMKGYFDPEKPKHKWYHLSEITFRGDSVFLKQSPVGINKKDTLFSATDGGFYSYAGMLEQYKGSTAAFLTLVKCDYCPRKVASKNPEPIERNIKRLVIEKKENDDIILVGNNIYRRQKK